MKDIELFQLALGLKSPWMVSALEFNPEQKSLQIKIDFEKGSIFPCPKCDQIDLKAYDTVEKSWRHLNFFQHEAYLTARVPRVDCPKWGVRLIGNLPWAREDSGFTFLFEFMIMTLVKSMPIKTLAAFVGEHDTRLWRILHHYVDKGVIKSTIPSLKMLGLMKLPAKKAITT